MIKVFVISLPRLSARREAIRSNLESQGVTNFEIVDGVDGANLPAKLKEIVSIKGTLEKMGRPMTGGEIGCALSHIHLYQRMQRERIAEAVILEDDACVGPSFAKLVSGELLSDLAYNLVLFHSLKCDVLKYPVGELESTGQLFRPLSNPYGTMAYYLNLSTAQRLLQVATPVSCCADWPGRVHLWPRVGILYPFVVYPKQNHKADSTIETERYQLMTSWREAAPDRMGWGLLLFPRLLAPARYGRLKDFPKDISELLFRTVSKTVRAILGRSIGTDQAPEGWPHLKRVREDDLR